MEICFMKQYYKLSISIVVLALALSSVKAQSNVQDSMALVDLYNSTNGTSWKNNTNWLTKQPLSTWFGVTVVAGRITVITLQSNSLRGNLPSSFGDLSQLTIAHFEQDSILGSIPATIGKLTNIQMLAFSGNKISGSIPSSIGNLSQLSYLDFSFNHLNGNIPAEIGLLKNLNSLFLNSNSLLGGIPENIGNLTSLTYLYLDYNELTDSIPASIGNCINLKTLSLSNNHITGKIPFTIGNFKTLFKLDLSVNNLIGSIPTSIGNVTSLIRINFSYNKLTGNIPNSIGNLTTLVLLNLDNNNLCGAIPKEIISITGINNFPLFNNNFTFAGIEAIASKAQYSPQARITIKQNGNLLSVSVGGTPANNTFKWYNNATLVATTTSDSTFTITSIGKYWVVATNAVASQLTLFSDTAFISTLPIETISLTSTNDSRTPLLQWQTIGESNTLNFEIENSIDGINFISEDKINAVGSGNNKYSYQLLFETSHALSVIDNNAYYRIKAIDKTGNYSYSNVVSLSLNNSKSTVNIYPNPLVGSNEIHVNGNHIREVSIINMHGIIISTTYYNDVTNPTILINKVNSGQYAVMIKQQDGTKRMLKLLCQ